MTDWNAHLTPVRQSYVAQLTALLDQHAPAGMTTYVYFGPTWPLVLEAGYANDRQGCAYLRCDEGAAPVIVALETYLGDLECGAPADEVAENADQILALLHA